MARILNRNITVNSSSFGSGAGSGYDAYGNSTVGNPAILNRNSIESSSSDGSGIHNCVDNKYGEIGGSDC
jgi:hypothetical protein